MKQVSHSIDRVDVTFERTLVANAGLILVGTLALRLDLGRWWKPWSNSLGG